MNWGKMKTFLVKTNSSIEYIFEAHHFEIIDSICYFYAKDGDPIWVIKDWISFRQLIDEQPNPDEFYENLKEE